METPEPTREAVAAAVAALGQHLQALCDNAPDHVPTLTQLIDNNCIPRSSAYAILAGKRLPSADHLGTLVTAWEGDVQWWLDWRTRIAQARRSVPRTPRKPRKPRGASNTGDAALHVLPVAFEGVLDDIDDSLRYYKPEEGDDTADEARRRLIGLVANAVQAIASDITDAVTIDSTVTPQQIVTELRRLAAKLAPESVSRYDPVVNWPSGSASQTIKITVKGRRR